MPDTTSIQNLQQSLVSRHTRAYPSPLKPSTRNITSRVAIAGLVLLLGTSIAFTSRAEDRQARTFAPAQSTTSESAVQAVLTQRKVVKSQDGAEKFEDASTVKPGDVIEYQVVYTNTGTKPVTGLVADLPIPEGLAYQPFSAKPGASRVKAATKDGTFSAEPLSRNVAGIAEKIPYADYRSLRWTLGQLSAHAVATVTARAQVESVIPVLPVSTEKRTPESATDSRPSITR